MVALCLFSLLFSTAYARHVNGHIGLSMHQPEPLADPWRTLSGRTLAKKKLRKKNPLLRSSVATFWVISILNTWCYRKPHNVSRVLHILLDASTDPTTSDNPNHIETTAWGTEVAGLEIGKNDAEFDLQAVQMQPLAHPPQNGRKFA